MMMLDYKGGMGVENLGKTDYFFLILCDISACDLFSKIFKFLMKCKWK